MRSRRLLPGTPSPKKSALVDFRVRIRPGQSPRSTVVSRTLGCCDVAWRVLIGLISSFCFLEAESVNQVVECRAADAEQFCSPAHVPADARQHPDHGIFLRQVANLPEVQDSVFRVRRLEAEIGG